MEHLANWKRLAAEAKSAGLAVTGLTIHLGRGATLSLDMGGGLELCDGCFGDYEGEDYDLPNGEQSTIVEILEFIHVLRFSGSARLIEDRDAPLPWSVWLGDDLIMGAGNTALEAIREARAEVARLNETVSSSFRVAS